MMIKGRMKISSLILLNCILAGQILFAQPAWKSFYGDQLNSQTINTHLADRSGNLWLGTEAGVRVYTDGEWSYFSRIGDSVMKSYQNIGEVRHLWEDTRGNIWVVCAGKLFIYSEGMWIFVNDKDYGGYTVKYLLNDSREEIWLCSEYSEVNKYAGLQSRQHIYGTVIHYGNSGWLNHGRDIGDEIYVQPGNPDEFYTGIIEDQRGYVWIGTVTGLNIHALTGWITLKDETLPNRYVTGLTLDGSGNVWVATVGGVARFDGTGWQIYRKADGLGGNNVRQICCDSQGRIWAFTYGGINLQGLNCFENGKWTFFESGRDIPSGNMTCTMEEFRQSNVLLTRSGFACLNGKTWMKSGVAENIEGSRFYTMEPDTAGVVYLSTDKGLFRGEAGSFNKIYAPGQGSWEVVAMMKDSHGRIWTAAEDGLIYLTTPTTTMIFGTSDGLPGEPAREIVEDAQGRIWAIFKRSAAVYEF